MTRWQGIADSLGIDFIPAVSPGFNDTAVRTGHLPISRKIDDETGEFGSLFEAQLAGAKRQYGRRYWQSHHGNVLERMARGHPDRARQRGAR